MGFIVLLLLGFSVMRQRRSLADARGGLTPLLLLIYLAARQERAPRFEALIAVQGQAQDVRVGPVRGRSPAMWFALTVRQPGGSGTYQFRAAAGDAAAQTAQVAGGRDPVTVWVEPGFAEAASTPATYQIMLGARMVLSYEDARAAQERRRRYSLMVLVPAAAVVAFVLWRVWRRW